MSRKPGAVHEVELVALPQASPAMPPRMDDTCRRAGCVWFVWRSGELALGDRIESVTVRVAGSGVIAELVLQHFAELEPIADAATSVGTGELEQLALLAWPVRLRAGFWPRVIVTATKPNHRIVGASARVLVGAGGDPEPN